ncbi:MAG: hypothetical protein A2622_12085 [Bdellovibrionales bacterium RIFCSPHIGHO2_01_FULL_40_29]|nr:MAG: hypothetical protein A2622_12085 [Bdellovibrionales bacterium RIFCSPHIGHO2_01_FULL_40_29]OFZ35598.1 MAG: hypothetical protein A3D17_00455 [Bdellovibrionales bacterium RIFCSPHIGHO2_02_FULL_40_15]
MTSTFEASGFQIITTNDGSPTLLSKKLQESMHHSAGAATETWYIYGSVLEKALSLEEPLRICTVGLGLGYIEMAWAALEHHQTSLDTFEIVECLKSSFQDWFLSSDEDPAAIHHMACAKLLQKQKSLQTVHDIKVQLRKNPPRFHGSILDFSETQKWNVICFDAFSKKSSGDLWTPEFLDTFLREFTDKNCVFTTYACTGTLKRALLNHGFQWIERPGFSGKRDSTLAIRGSVMSRAFQTFSHSQ